MSTININDQIFAQTALAAFIANCPQLSAFSHSYNAESAQVGDRVIVPRVEALVATTFDYTSNSGFPYEQSGGVINAVTVVMDQKFILPVDSTDLQAANSSAGLDSFAVTQGEAMAKAVWQRIATLFTTVNFGVAVASSVITGYTRATTVSVRQLMSKRDVPVNKLSFIVNQDVMTSWLGDATIYQVYSSGLDSLQSGKISQLAGVKVYDCNVIPTNGISLVGVVAHPDSLAVACRYLAPQENTPYSAAFAVTDKESGITLGYRRHMSPGRGTMFVNFDAFFGFAVGLSLGLGIMVRTD